MKRCLWPSVLAPRCSPWVEGVRITWGAPELACGFPPLPSWRTCFRRCGRGLRISACQSVAQVCSHFASLLSASVAGCYGDTSLTGKRPSRDCLLPELLSHRHLGMELFAGRGWAVGPKMFSTMTMLHPSGRRDTLSFSSDNQTCLSDVA